MKNPFKKSLEVPILGKRKYPTEEEAEEQRKKMLPELEGKCILGSRKFDEIAPSFEEERD